MMEGRMADSKMPSDEVELLTNEFKRVKGNTGRFKVKKQKINFESFVDDVRPQETSEQTGPQEPLLVSSRNCLRLNHLMLRLRKRKRTNSKG